MHAFIKNVYKRSIKNLYTNLHNKKINTINTSFRKVLVYFLGLNIITEYSFYNTPSVQCVQSSPTLHPNIRKLSP